MTDSEILRHAAKILERETRKPDSLTLNLFIRLLLDLADELQEPQTEHLLLTADGPATQPA